MEWEHKLHYQPLMTKVSFTQKSSLENYQENIRESEKSLNDLSEKGWELFSTHVTAFNMLVFIFRRKPKANK
ncbi:MAG: hypothetical protein V1888_01260 [archaeon]